MVWIDVKRDDGEDIHARVDVDLNEDDGGTARLTISQPFPRTCAPVTRPYLRIQTYLPLMWSPERTPRQTSLVLYIRGETLIVGS